MTEVVKATSEDLLVSMQAAVEHIALSFTLPDDDFSPMLFLVTPVHTLIVPLVDVFTDKPRRDVFLRGIMPGICQKFGATMLGMVTSQWRGDEVWFGRESHADPRGPRAGMDALFEKYGELSKMPGSYETVEVRVAVADSEVSKHAVIRRHEGKPPTLGEWLPDPMEGVTGGTQEGAMVGVMMAALRRKKLS